MSARLWPSLVARPRPIPRERYDELSSKFCRDALELTNVVSVYQFGSVKSPGISDLDMLVVTRGRPKDWGPFGMRAWSADERYIFSHEPFVCDVELFRALPLVYHAANLIHRGGDELEQVEPSESHLDNLRLQLAIDYSVAIAQRLLSMVRDGALSIRYAIPSLAAIRHTAAVLRARDADLVDDELGSYLDEATRLHEDWFKMTAADADAFVVDMAARGIDQLIRLLEILARAVPESDATAPAATFHNRLGHVIVGGERSGLPTVERSISEAIRFRRWRGRAGQIAAPAIPIFAPPTLFEHWLTYAERPGGCGADMASRFHPLRRPLASRDYLEVARVRAHWAEHHRDYLLAAGFLGGQFDPNVRLFSALWRRQHRGLRYLFDGVLMTRAALDRRRWS